MNPDLIRLVRQSFQNTKIYSQSCLEKDGRVWLLGKQGPTRFLIIVGYDFPADLEGKSGPGIPLGEPPRKTVICEGSSSVIAFLRKQFPHLAPIPFGAVSAFGCGDRLGLATPGHIQAVQDSGFRPMLAQQSIRENSRTGRTMRGVIDDAAWGAFEVGYTGGFGADIDHIKQFSDIECAVEAGYTFFTIDPSDHVHDEVQQMSRDEVLNQYRSIPGIDLIEKRHLGRTYKIEGITEPIVLEGEQFYRTALTYLEALNHLEKSYMLLVEKKGESNFDFEASVDETATPTTSLAHIFIAEELRARGVSFNSLALRFVGEFEKGIDYIGDLSFFEQQFSRHAAIARHFGGYKIGVHSGSDKFSIYPIIAKYTRGNFHVKTAGTSWLEAVHLVAKTAPDLYRRMHRIALQNFEKDRASYHISADLNRIKPLDNVPDAALEEYLDQNDSRQLLHITYGSILNANSGALKGQLYKLLAREEDTHYKLLSSHIGNHIKGLLVS